MYLVDSSGCVVASVWARPLGPRHWSPGATSGPCDRCGVINTRERCTIHVGAAVPHDRDGGHFTPWSCRCRPCELAVVRALYGLMPETPQPPPSPESAAAPSPGVPYTVVHLYVK